MASLPKQYLCLTLMALQVVHPAHAHAQALRQAPLVVPTSPGVNVVTSPNGVPIVNILNPNSAGVSHNLFEHYNVGPNGLILNNAVPAPGVPQSVMSQVEPGGRIGANPNLTNSAQTIIGEVVRPNPSELLGKQEIAGPGANFVLANPYGITCNGCGFINTPQVTLGAGRPEFGAAGEYVGIKAADGTVHITGTGADAKDVDAFTLVGGKLKIDGKIETKDLTLKGGTGEATTDYVIDSSLLGMHANSISLIATGAGAGVRVAGDAAATAGDLTITADGRIDLSNTVTASGTLTAEGETLTQSGEMKGNAGVTLKAETLTVAGKVDLQ